MPFEFVLIPVAAQSSAQAQESWVRISLEAWMGR